jgi:polyhydroxyalkanoate synthesis repressor PhaR
MQPNDVLMKKLLCLSMRRGLSSRLRDRQRRPASGREGGSAARAPGMGMKMTNEKKPVTIKKYANRRLYNTGASAYVTLEDRAGMVKHGEYFCVYDAKSGEDITRSVLAQIIFEQENKTGQNLLPIRFLRQLIRFYGDSMQMFVPSYLEFSIERLTKDSQKFREQFEAAMSANPLANPLANPTRQMFQSMEEQARKNMAMFHEALDMFSPFGAGLSEASKSAQPVTKSAQPVSKSAQPPSKPAESASQPGQPAPLSASELNDMRAQRAEMQKRIDSLVKKD